MRDAMIFRGAPCLISDDSEKPFFSVAVLHRCVVLRLQNFEFFPRVRGVPWIFSGASALLIAQRSLTVRLRCTHWRADNRISVKNGEKQVERRRTEAIDLADPRMERESLRSVRDYAPKRGRIRFPFESLALFVFYFECSPTFSFEWCLYSRPLPVCPKERPKSGHLIWFFLLVDLCRSNHYHITRLVVTNSLL